MTALTRTRRFVILAATIIVLIVAARWIWSGGARDRAVRQAVEDINAGQWSSIFERALADESRIMGCDSGQFSRLVAPLWDRANVRLGECQLVAEPGGRAVAEYTVVLTTRKGESHQNTFTLYVTEADGEYLVSIGDLAFQLALLAPSSSSDDVRFLSGKMRGESVRRLLNPREMIYTTPDLMDVAVASAERERNFNPAVAWRKVSGF